MGTIDGYFAWIGKGGIGRVLIGLVLPVILVIAGAGAIVSSSDEGETKPIDAQATPATPTDAQPRRIAHAHDRAAAAGCPADGYDRAAGHSACRNRSTTASSDCDHSTSRTGESAVPTWERLQLR
jgi:hypothetical protein